MVGPKKDSARSHYPGIHPGQMHSSAAHTLSGLRRALTKFGFLGVSDRVLREVWLRLGLRILHFLGISPKRSYGWREAVFFPVPDYWLRYGEAIEQLSKQMPVNRPLRVLEVGSGYGGIAWLLPNSPMKICMVDRATDVFSFRDTGRSWKVCSDGGVLPFQDGAFDIVLSLDTLEHISRERRNAFAQELKRVSNAAVILGCPVHSPDGKFRAAEFDRLLTESLRTRGRTAPDWLDDHIEKVHPNADELLQLFPGSRLEGAVDCPAWLRSTSAYLRPLGWLRAGVLYLSHLKKHGLSRSFYRATVVWSKTCEPIHTGPEVTTEK